MKSGRLCTQDYTKTLVRGDGMVGMELLVVWKKVTLHKFCVNI